MSTVQNVRFEELNQRYLVAAVGRIREFLEHHIDHPGDTLYTIMERGDNNPDLLRIREEMEFQPPLETISAVFGLSAFERDILLMCAGVELDSSLAKMIGTAGKAHPDFSLALSVFPEAHWSALSPLAPLRYWRLIEIINAQNLTESRLKIDECMLHYLVGLGYYDERIDGYIEQASPAGMIATSHRRIVKQATAVLESQAGITRQPLLQFYGNDGISRHAIASAVCSELGLNLSTMSALVIPREVSESDALARLWERQAALTRGVLLLDCTGVEKDSREAENATSRFIGNIHSFLIVSGRERRSLPERTSVGFEVSKPTPAEQLAYWRSISNSEESPNGEFESLVSQFNLDTEAIKSIYDEATKFEEIHDGEGGLIEALWDACRARAQRRLDELAYHIHSSATWDELVLPEAPIRLLEEIAAQVRQRLKVYETWGFGSRLSRGLGITTLFFGPSGTGKTMAAEVLANELHLDLYRIDLSQVVSKYIGETEKNLRRVFDAAEDGGAILLFDEADALFGKRSEVKDSHDRYANIEVSYLLQRMEDYRGLAILTTNRKEALDDAFMRRLRFVVQFPFPSAERRREIWCRIFPPRTPTRDLDTEKMARLNVSGGNIRNIALYAAFLAAEEGEPVSMKHVLRAARVEYGKLEMSLTDSEIKGWVRTT
ncbi:MAG: ATP-binding protein [Actinomycetota bacterium]|nr:ATP-binding protein [Actinomycetota bacterium]